LSSEVFVPSFGSNTFFQKYVNNTQKGKFKLFWYFIASLPIASLSDGHVAAVDANGVTGRAPFDAGDDGVKRFRIEDVTAGV
jgi:hypothetical protein